jgi:hypothetical protein
VYFSIHSGEFSWPAWTVGLVLGIVNSGGILFINLAFTCDVAIGVAVALLSSQTLIILVYESINARHFPNYIQLIAFVVGIVGSLILVIPDHMYSVWFTLTRCKSPPKSTVEASKL